MSGFAQGKSVPFSHQTQVHQYIHSPTSSQDTSEMDINISKEV